jgi:hypothetical protein
MSDRFDSLFEGLRGQDPPVPFAPAPAVRRRGRRRAHRQAAMAGVAVLAVTGLGAGGLVATGGPEPGPGPNLPPPATGIATSPAGTPAPRPELTTIPPGRLLAAADLAGTGWAETSNELLEGEWYWDGAQAWCPGFRIEDYPSLRQRRDLRTVSWWRTGEALPERVDQIVELFDPGAGAVNLADVRRYVQLCSRRPAPDDPVAPIWYGIEATGFAGEESLLLRVEPYHFTADDRIEPVGEFHHVAVVRVGELVTTIVYQAGGDVREVARRAADRLG